MGPLKQIQLGKAIWDLWFAFMALFKELLKCLHKSTDANPARTYSLGLGFSKTFFKVLRVALGGVAGGTATAWWLVGSDQLISLLPTAWSAISGQPDVILGCVLWFLWELLLNYKKFHTIQAAIQQTIQDLSDKKDEATNFQTEEPTPLLVQVEELPPVQDSVKIISGG